LRFWDSSALVPLVCDETQTKFCQKLLRVDPSIVVWSLASVEVYSALCLRFRDGSLSKETYRLARDRNALLWKSCSEVTQFSLVKKRAYRILDTHQLRAADAMHLAAALIAFEEHTSNTEFVTFDRRLGEAAEKEGFLVTGPDQFQ
jgi:uncharacterized protein